MMKQLIKSILVLVMAQSCAMFSYEVAYFADSTGASKCHPYVIQQGLITYGAKPSVEQLNAWMEQTGYSQCKSRVLSGTATITECQKPHHYKHVVSKTPAQCNHLLSEFKIVK